jgi:RNA polymerase sigma-70 factor (ECF subfamily)
VSELDRATLERCRRGNAEAFRALVRAYQDRVFGLCVALAGADGEDLAQETFVRVHGSIKQFEPQGPAALSTWILKIARRLCIDRARGARVRLAAPEVEVASNATPEHAVSARQTGDRLRAAIAALPEDQRAVIALREWDGLEYEAIAEIEGVPVGTIRSRLARAREALRTALADLKEENVA